MKRLPVSVLAGAAVLAVVLVLGVVWLTRGGDEVTTLDLGTFEAKVLDGEVAEATLHDGSNRVTGTLTDGTEYEAPYPEQYADEVTTTMLEAGLDPEVDPSGDPLWLVLVLQLAPIVLIVAVAIWLVGAMRGSGPMGKLGRKRLRTPGQGEEPDVTFADVAGCDEAVAELAELRDFLEDPERFASMGANIPRGVLLVGPPGTGKTLLARAVAGEAGVPFFSLSGSDFVEMYVGVGASRVRDLFEQARKAAPAIVFVDEIDAVGRQRGAGVGGGHDEREQTLNQLLVEMDGFDARSGVIFIGATNRPDILDPALLRPGRFDRQVVVDQPDLDGRRAILAVHAEGRPLTEDVDLGVVARRTPGFTGADLENLVNEAAILAARYGEPTVSMARMEEAIDRVLGGPERRSKVLTEEERRVVAYHESGHALVGHVLPRTDPIHKISIVARGRALGWTLALPEVDRTIHTRAELQDQMAMLLGGRTAEELVFGDPSTGAQDDIERATELARAMVTRFGMSDAIGPMQLGSPGGEVFLGRDLGHEPTYSDEVAARVDEEIRRLVEGARASARAILEQHRSVLDDLATALMAHETLAGETLDALVAPAVPRPATGADAPVGR